MEEKYWEGWKKILPKEYIWECKGMIRENIKGKAEGGIITEGKKEWKEKRRKRQRKKDEERII